MLFSTELRGRAMSKCLLRTWLKTSSGSTGSRLQAYRWPIQRTRGVGASRRMAVVVTRLPGAGLVEVPTRRSPSEAVGRP
jgi:hypothetical protein